MTGLPISPVNEKQYVVIFNIIISLVFAFFIVRQNFRLGGKDV